VDVVVLCGPSLDEFQRKVIETFLSADSSERIVGCVIDERLTPSLWRRMITNIQRGRGGYVLIMALNRLGSRRTATASTEDLFARLDVPVLRADDPYEEETVRVIRELQPGALLLIGGFGILKPPMLDMTPQGTLSYHHGDMRRYRGQPPAFWELYNGERSIGVTVQRLSPEIDCGQPIAERSFPIREDDTLRSLSNRIFAGSTDMMIEAVRRLQEPSFRAETITSFGHLYTLPNLRQWLVFHARVGRRLLAARLRDRRDARN
jgi:folate-dependent phosphoribosylglycinamide formyltransferase PurN